MKRSIALLPLLILLASCAGITPGNDPVVVNAERSTVVAVDVFDTFTKWEYDNRKACAAFPEIRESADRIRTGGPDWLASARHLTQAYKQNRTPENKANLATAIALLRAAMVEANDYLPVEQQKKLPK